MWLWYLEVYLFTLLAFGAGALVGLLLVRLVVRRRTDDPSIVSSPASSGNSPAQPAEQAGAAT